MLHRPAALPIGLTKFRSPQAVLKPQQAFNDRAGVPRAALKSGHPRSTESRSNQLAHRLLGNRVIEPKLTVNDPNDKHEKEADRMAEQVMRMSVPPTDSRLEEGVEDGNVQRMCPRCQRRYREGKPLNCKECENVQGKETSPKTPVDSDPTEQIQSLRRGGKRLPDSVRSFFEPRFGENFSDVRVHTGGRADEVARSMNAKAFTVGKDVAFRSGAYRPETKGGKQLLAHELTHVIQQSEGDKAALQRWSYGSGTPPDPDQSYAPPPNDERPRVESALDIVERIANNPNDYPQCHQRFQNLCNTPNPNELQHRLSNAVVWKDTTPSAYGRSVGTNDMAYTDLTWRWGKWMLASTFVHELMHLCGHDNESDIAQTERVCGLPVWP